jgi:hypothetical protein
LIHNLLTGIHGVHALILSENRLGLASDVMSLLVNELKMYTTNIQQKNN